MATSYRVTAPLVLLKVLDQAGKAQVNGFYSGAILPGSVTKADGDNLKRHLDRGWVEEVDEPVVEPAPVPAEPPAPPAPTPVADPEAVPTGTAPEVMAWVGTDPDRAQRALAEEKKAERPRTTLTTDLEKVVAQQSQQ